MNRHRRRLSAGIAITAALVIAACGGRDDESAPPTTATTPDTTTAQATTPPGSTDGTAGSVASTAVAGATTPVNYEPGITDTEIKLGTSVPQSGPLSAFAVLASGMKVYFDAINAEDGGVTMADGKTRQVSLVAYDDGFEPARALANAQRLVEEDEVFALLGSYGGANVKAMRPYLNEQSVPQLYVMTLEQVIGTEAADYPWTSLIWPPTFAAEGAAFAQTIIEETPDAKVAVAWVNAGAGEEFLASFKASIEGTGVELVADRPVEVSDPSIDATIAALQGSGANVFINYTPVKFVTQGIRRVNELGWELDSHFISVAAAQIETTIKPAGFENAQGIRSSAYLKDPADMRWATDDAVTTYKERVAEHGDGLNADDVVVLQGYGVAETMVKTLELAQPTRQGLRDAANNLDDIEIDVLQPGITLTTGPDDPWPMEAMQLVRFEGEQWVPDGPLQSTRAP